MTPGPQNRTSGNSWSGYFSLFLNVLSTNLNVPFTVQQTAYLARLHESPPRMLLSFNFLISKCLPIMLYGLDVCCLRKAEVNSLDFVINRFCMKLFRTNNMNTIKDCQTYFNLNLLSELLVKRYNKFVEIVCN